jgi:hypothetical protein
MAQTPDKLWTGGSCRRTCFKKHPRFHGRKVEESPSFEQFGGKKGVVAVGLYARFGELNLNLDL